LILEEHQFCSWKNGFSKAIIESDWQEEIQLKIIPPLPYPKEERDMRRSSIIIAILSAMIGLPATAETWKHGFERRMDNYSVSRGAARVMLVCDPDRTRHPDTKESAAFVLLTLPDDPDASTAVFLADTGHQAELRLKRQTGLQKDNPEAWEAMIGMIRDGGNISVVTAKTSVTFDLDPVAELSCL
jgi:hypothetical protein